MASPVRAWLSQQSCPATPGDNQMRTFVVALLTLSAAAISAPAQNQDDASGSSRVRTVRSTAGAIRVQHLATLDNPYGMAFLPDGGLLVTEKPGRLRIYRNGRLGEPLGGVPRVDYKGQRGLLDVEVDPNFARNRYVYIYYSEAAESQPAGARDQGDPRFLNFVDTTDVLLTGGAVARARLDGNALADVTVIWRQVPKTIGRGHEGGRLTFGADGKLYINSGERMRFDPAQDSTGNLGKIVRINPDGSVPSDNPFANRHGWHTDIYTLGHRNPMGAAVDPSTRKLWIHEMGPAGGDEINLNTAGSNYGWPVVSNGDNYDGSHIPDHITQQKFQQPAHAWIP